jgi:fermentation-respiration switch protein FrsA (DUF1100 family)
MMRGRQVLRAHESDNMTSRFLGLAALAFMAIAPAHAEDATGYWGGNIAHSLNVFVTIEKAAAGGWEGTLMVPQQGLVTKVDKLVVTDDGVSFALLGLGATYAARWNAQQKAWDGNWVQGGQTAPLVLTRTDASATALKRPQEQAIAARAPAYASSVVTFANDKAGVRLEGVLTVPPGNGPFPAVVLVQGSGPLDRDETILEHKPFLVLADHLSRHGIAVLRYDKRGVGKSSGEYASATTFDFAGDADAALRFLRGRAEVDTHHIGIIGHSEGGLIAPLLASHDPAIAYIVMLAGPGVRGELLLAEQFASRSRLNGAPGAVVAQEQALNKAMFAILASEPDAATARAKATQLIAAAQRNGTLPPGMNESLVATFSTPWFLTFLRLEPVPVLQAVRQPVLALNGSLDYQVPAAMDLPPIRAALKDNPHATVIELPKLNHLFQTATTGGSAEYATIEESIAPVVLETVSDWIHATVRQNVGLR